MPSDSAISLEEPLLASSHGQLERETEHNVADTEYISSPISSKVHFGLLSVVCIRLFCKLAIHVFFLFHVFVPIIFFSVLNVTFLIYVLFHKLQDRSWISDQIVAQYWQDSLNNLHHTDRSERSHCSLAGSWYSECHYSVT